MVILRQTLGKLVDNVPVEAALCTPDGFAVIHLEAFELESPSVTGTSIPTRPTFAPDMTSLITFGRKLPRKNAKNAAPTA